MSELYALVVQCNSNYALNKWRVMSNFCAGAKRVLRPIQCENTNIIIDIRYTGHSVRFFSIEKERERGQHRENAFSERRTNERNTNYN